MLRRLICIGFALVLATAGLAAASAQFTPARDDLVSMRRPTLDAAEAWAEEFLALTPGVESYAVVEPGHLVVTTAGGGEVDIFLDNLMARFEASPKTRAADLSMYEANLADTFARLDGATEPDPANVLPIIRHQDFLLAFPADAPPEAQAVHRTFAGSDAAVILAYDSPTGIGIMSKLSMGIENLSDEEAIDFALSNFEQFSTGFSWADRGGLRYASLDDNYESSLILLDEVWDELEADLGGPVAVAIPTRNVLAAGRADSPEDVAKLRALIEEATFDPYSVSEDVFVRRDGETVVLEP